MIKSRRIKWAENVARTEEMINAHNILVGKPEGKRLHVRPRRRCEDNIRMDLREIGLEDVDWMYRDRCWAVVNTAMNLWVP
jgi:hypothetical protein